LAIIFFNKAYHNTLSFCYCCCK